MAVHSHAFHPYQGERTAPTGRWLVLARYALGDALAQKKTVGLLVLSSFPLLGAASLIYLHHNLEAIKILPPQLLQAFPIDARFFCKLLGIQCFLAFLLTAATGARVLVADLRDNALPLYLARPLSRFEYVLGKAAALAVLLSLVTWIPDLLLVGFQGSLAGGWIVEHWWIAPGIVLGAWAAILLFVLVCLAVAAVIKRRAAAEAAFAALFFVVPLVAQVIDQFLHTRWAAHLFVPAVLEAIWLPLFRLPPSQQLSLVGGLASLAVALAGASAVLARRVRAWEIVR